MNKFLTAIDILFILLLMMALTEDKSWAQESVPRQISPQEFVTFDKSLPMKTALSILSQFSSRYDGKIIIDPLGHNMPIGVMVNNMYWKRALEYILRSNLLKYNEKERYFEVMPLTQTEETEEGDKITTNTKEIEINALFFEADYSALREAGIDWSVLHNGKVAVSGNFGSEVTKDLFRAQYRNSFRQWDVFTLLRTFETMDKGEVIANPQIKVMDRQEGKIKVGTNFFLTTRDFAGNTRFTEYESGIILTVTPTVMGTRDSTYIHLELKTERSAVAPDPVAVTKAITESNTQVLLVNGEETVIAGLFSNEVKNTRRGIPILKDLPPWFFGLRYLFGYTSKEVKKKELIIILQATVLPTVEERLSMRLGQKNYIEQKRLEFKRRLQKLKSSKSSNGAYYRRKK
ncbi:MAG: type II secretion system protein GspD [bacterium]